MESRILYPEHTEGIHTKVTVGINFLCFLCASLSVLYGKMHSLPDGPLILFSPFLHSTR